MVFRKLAGKVKREIHLTRNPTTTKSSIRKRRVTRSRGKRGRSTIGQGRRYKSVRGALGIGNGFSSHHEIKGDEERQTNGEADKYHPHRKKKRYGLL